MSGKTNLLRDASRKALPAGRRVSKEGNVYYENRANRADRGTYGKYHLAEGGMLSNDILNKIYQKQVEATEGGFFPEYKDKYKQYLLHFGNHYGIEVFFEKEFEPQIYIYNSELKYLGSANSIKSKNEIKKVKLSKADFKGTEFVGYKWKDEGAKFNDGGYLTDPTFGDFQSVVFARGGSVKNERRHVNHEQDYEVRYARTRPSRTGYKGKRGFSDGGDVDGNEVIKLKVYAHSGNIIREGDFLINYNDSTITFPSGKTFKVVPDREYTIKLQKTQIKANRGIVGLADFIKQINTPDTPFKGLATDLIDLGKDGKYELGGNVVGFDLAGHLDGTLNVGQDDGMLSGVTGTQYSGLVGETGAMSSGEMFARGGSVRNERRHVNHEQDYEVRYARNKPSRTGYKGKRSFADGGDFQAGVYANGGDLDSPKIYVADLEAYNNGKLVGEWLDLSDYNDADELDEAIQDLLKEWGAEEYAIHDAENIPSGMYSEYMGAKDFAELYEMIDLAKENDLPLAVVQEVVSQYDTDAIDNFYGRYDSAVDFAEQLVDDTGIQSFTDFERYLIISDTDKRLLAQEMADNYVDDIRTEDDGERLIEEAELDLEEYQEADEDTREEMLDKAREIVYDRIYEDWENGLDDPYNFLVEEQGLYDAESFANANFVQIDYDAIADALEYDYTFVEHDGEVYVFDIH